MTAEGNRAAVTNHLRGYVDAVETLDKPVDVSPTLSGGHDEMPYGTPPTSPSYADSQDEKSHSSQFVIALTDEADNTRK